MGLSRLVSETWIKNGENEAIFIDRDGENFAHVLNYLRYGEVKIPIAVSMDSLMKDMDFYGIEVIESNVKDAQCDATIEKYLNDKIKKKNDDIKKLSNERAIVTTEK